MIYGYARVSTLGQQVHGNSLEDQIAQLKNAGCETIVTETYSGKTTDRPEFGKLIASLSEGDMLVVTRLDRFARSAVEGVESIKGLFDRGISVNILNMGIVENSLVGNLILTVMLAFAEYERCLIIERTAAGKAVARKNPDFRDGRPPKYGIK